MTKSGIFVNDEVHTNNHEAEYIYPLLEHIFFFAYKHASLDSATTDTIATGLTSQPSSRHNGASNQSEITTVRDGRRAAVTEQTPATAARGVFQGSKSRSKVTIR